MDKTVFFDLSYGLYCVSSFEGKRGVGCIANSIMQITSEPSKIAVSLNKNNYTAKVIDKTRKLAVSILSEETGSPSIGELGFLTSENYNKFDNLNHIELDDFYILDDKTCGYFLCDVEEIVDCGTHKIYVCLVTEGKRNEPHRAPMTYAYYHNVIKGRAPKNAPTYVAEEESKQETDSVYVCDVCGYQLNISDEDFRKLEDYHCPICGADKSHFKKKLEQLKGTK